MSSKFLTFMFIILVSVQLSCGWSLWKNDKQEESSTEKTTEKSFKDDEPNSSPAVPIEVDASKLPLPKDPNVSSDNDEDESSSADSDQPPITASTNVSAMPNEEFDGSPEEESSESPNSEKEIKSLPTTSTNSTDKIVNYVSSKTTQITDNSTPTTEKSESESSTFDNTNTSTATENTLDGTDDVNNVARNVDEDRGDAKVTSSVISSSTISNLDDNGFLNDTGVSNSSEYTAPKVTYFNNSKDGNSTSDIDEETLTPTDWPTIGRIVPHSPREVNQSTDYSTQKIATENYESRESTTDMTDAPTTTENTINSTSNNEARNVINKTESSDNEDSKPEIIKDLDQSPSSEANTTIKTILSTSTNTMNTTEMAGSMSNVTTPEVNFGSFVNSGSTGNTYSQLILNLCILIFSISVIV